MLRIEVTGDSIPEVADKLLALGRSLKATASYDADNAAREALQVERDAKPKATRKAKAEEAKPEADAGEPGTVGPAETEPSTGSSDDTNASTASTSPSEPALDFDKDVAPVVLDAVAAIGKDKVVELIGQFGAARASEVDPAQWPELVALLKGAQ